MKRRSWQEDVFHRFMKDTWGICALVVLFAFFVTACLVWMGLVAHDWHLVVHEAGYSPISQRYWFGTNLIGQDIFSRCIYSTKTAFEVGFLVASVSTFVGVFLGTYAGYNHGKWEDRLITWLFSCIDAVPFYLLAAAIAFAFKGSHYGLHLAMILTLWTSTCKVIRAQVMKLKNFEFVSSAKIVGLTEKYIIRKYIIPNLTPMIIVEFTLSFVIAIKTEAVLSFLGLGVKNGVSWGSMLAEASVEIPAGRFHNFIAASLFMFTFVMTLNQLSESIQRALDPEP